MCPQCNLIVFTANEEKKRHRTAFGYNNNKNSAYKMRISWVFTVYYIWCTIAHNKNNCK